MNRDVVISKLETKAKRKIVISDIHGNLDLYQALLHQIDYKPGVDCLILLGDLIEKGKRNEYIKLDRDKSTFKSHRDFSSEIEITFKHF